MFYLTIVNKILRHCHSWFCWTVIRCRVCVLFCSDGHQKTPTRYKKNRVKPGKVQALSFKSGFRPGKVQYLSFKSGVIPGKVQYTSLNCGFRPGKVQYLSFKSGVRLVMIQESAFKSGVRPGMFNIRFSSVECG